MLLIQAKAVFVPDVVEPVALLALAEFAFNGDASQVVLPALLLGLFQLFAVFIGHLFRAAQRLAGKVNAALFEVVAVVACAVEQWYGLLPPSGIDVPEG